MIIHAVTRGGHGGIESQDVIVHASAKSIRAFAAPTILADRDLQFRYTGRQVSLDDPGVHPLFRDGIAAQGEAIPLLEEQRTGFGGGYGGDLVDDWVRRNRRGGWCAWFGGAVLTGTTGQGCGAHQRENSMKHGLSEVSQEPPRDVKR
jgi:hypothetical protein